MAKAADVKKAYSVAVLLMVVGGVWMLMARDSIFALGLFLAGAAGVAAAAFTSIRAKRRAEKSG